MGWGPAEWDTPVAVLDRATDAHADELFLDFSGDRYTYGRFSAEVNRLARGLSDLGVSPGETVATILDNGPDAAISWMAINRVGAISVPLNTALKGEFLRHQIVDVDSRVVLAESDYAGRVLGIADRLPQLKVVAHRGGRPEHAATGVELCSLDEIRTDGPGRPGRDPEPSDVATIIFTGGTTGPSKGCVISHNYMCNMARLTLEYNQRRAGELQWTPNPLFHLNAAVTTMLSTAMLGSAASFAPRFSVSGFWPEIERTGARVVALLGAMIPLIAQMPDTPEMLRCFGQIRVVTGNPFSPELARIWQERFGCERTGSPVYGLTEASVVTSTPPGVDPKPGTAGKRNRYFDVRIFDDHDEELPDGEVGEIVVRPLRPHVMFEGYWNRPEATAAVMRNQWFHTGDLGRFDEDGWLHFVDRKKDYLRRKGENISSHEMEVTFQQHPAIAEVAVHAVPSELSEDELKVTIVLEEGASLDPEELFAWSVERVPYYALPRYIEVRDSLPRSHVGRVLKYQLRDEGCTPATWDAQSAGVTYERR